MAYRTLKSIFHQRDLAAAAAEEELRRGSPAALHWQMDVGEHAMFALVTPEILMLTERILGLEPKIAAEWSALPPGAQSHYFISAIVDEIQATNEVEQVRSTRREIRAAVASLSAAHGAKNTRFTEMVRLYQSLGDDATASPRSLDDVRALYDAVAAGEIDGDDAPDGARFRAGPVIIESGIKVVHSGLTPESAIDDGLAEMLRQSADESIPRLIRAVVAHFIFEYVHPFYDGNGRTGRFLLALELRRTLAPIACLALSATIADSKDRYYRAFVEAEQSLNRGEITPFIIAMLELVAEAENRLLLDLRDRRKSLDDLWSRLQELAAAGSIADDEAVQLLYVLGQVWLFGDRRALLQELVDHSQRSKAVVRKRLAVLVDDDLVLEVTKKPLRFELSPAARELLGIDVERR